MRIALVSSEVNMYAGVPGYVASLARSLIKEHEVTIISARCEGLADTPVRFRKVNTLGTGGNLFDASFFLRNALMLRRQGFNGRREFDIVHSHHYCSPMFAYVCTSHYCEREGIERMRRLRTVARPGGAQRIRSQVMCRIEGALFGHGNGASLIVLSEGMKADFRRHYDMPRDGISVVHSGVDETRYNPENAMLFREKARRRHGLGPQDRLILFIGGDWERKGVVQAIEAVSRLGSDSVKLMVVGRGNQAASQRMARDLGVEGRVIFAGRCSESWQYYATGDVFLLPTHYEAFGLVILEAMASGLPVLVSRDAGTAELVRDGYDGLLLDDSHDVGEIVAKLNVLLNDEDLSRRLGARARGTALQYTWDRVARRTVDVYERVLARRAAGPDRPDQRKEGARRHAA